MMEVLLRVEEFQQLELSVLMHRYKPVRCYIITVSIKHKQPKAAV